LDPHFKKRGYFILIFSALILISLFLVFFVYNLQPVKSASSLELKVLPGQGLKEITTILSQAGLIKSVTAFKIYAVFSGRVRDFKPGIYRFNGQMNVPEIINLLVKGNNEEINIIIPEGATVKEIDKILSEADIITAGSLTAFDFYFQGVDNLEGFLYPDTYRFKIGSSVEEAINKFLDNFQEKIWSQISQKQNWYEILILASILEKEVVSFEDKQLVAGILEKRIKNNFPLQVDVAPITYSKLGWPSAPITNPNAVSVRAALQPKDSSYWFYLSDPKTKKTIFSKTLEEHNKNINFYLK